MVKSDVRVNLRNVIKDRGYIQGVIARKSNLSATKLSQILKLERKLEANELFDICAAINMTPMELWEYKENNTVPEQKEVV